MLRLFAPSPKTLALRRATWSGMVDETFNNLGYTYRLSPNKLRDIIDVDDPKYWG